MNLGQMLQASLNEGCQKLLSIENKIDTAQIIEVSEHREKEKGEERAQN